MNPFAVLKFSLPLFGLLYASIFVVSFGDSNELKDLLIESSNSLNFSYELLSTEDQDTNQTWKGMDFQIQNISSILSDHPSVAHSINLKNSSNSRYFFSKRKAASLTVTLKNYTHRLLFLNFTFFIGKVFAIEVTSEPESEKTIMGNINLIEEIIGAASNSTHSSQNTKDYSLSTSSPKATEGDESVAGSLSSHLKPLKTSEPIKMNGNTGNRNRRFGFNDDEIDGSNIHFQGRFAKRHANTNFASRSMRTTNVERNFSVASNADTESSTSTTNGIDLIKLKHALEMIKSAAGVVSKNPTTRPENVAQTTGHPGVYSNRSNTNSNTGTKYPLNATKVGTEITSPRPSANPKWQYTARSHPKTEESENSNLKNEKNQRKNNNKFVDYVETGKDYDDEPKYSGSAEKIRGHDAERKFSYKMWRASLEKKNRPSGFYVSVNDDIVFDNWDGIWDKHYVLGKWTGSKPLPNGKWNQTNLFLNWGNVTAGRDVKITFEWEPPSEDLDLVLTDIDISTLLNTEPSTPMPIPEKCTNKKEVKENKELINLKDNHRESKLSTIKETDVSDLR